MEVQKFITGNFVQDVEKIDRMLRVQDSFDLLKKQTTIGGRAAVFYFINGFCEEGIMQRIEDSLYQVKPEDMDKFFSDKKEDLEQVNANAYDFVLNGTEVGGGSIRIHDAKVQERMFQVLGLTREDADYKFGFIINAFKFGAPPHGGIAFGFDRFCALFDGQETIRDYIAFPKNNNGRDVMLDAPSYIEKEQMDELFIKSTAPAASEEEGKN